MPQSRAAICLAPELAPAAAGMPPVRSQQGLNWRVVLGQGAARAPLKDLLREAESALKARVLASRAGAKEVVVDVGSFVAAGRGPLQRPSRFLCSGAGRVVFGGRVG